jgi:hypothetical protein
MPSSLHAATVGTYLQILPKVGGLVGKAEAHCRANGLPDEALTDARLADDMWNFAKQVCECCRHSAQAIASLRSGLARPDPDPAPLDFASLHRKVADSLGALQTVDPDELDALAGRDVRFAFSDTRWTFTAEDFLLSYSVPNFHFHAATAFGVLRSRGLPIGKRDFLGKLRIKAA